MIMKMRFKLKTVFILNKIVILIKMIKVKVLTMMIINQNLKSCKNNLTRKKIQTILIIINLIKIYYTKILKILQNNKIQKQNKLILIIIKLKKAKKIKKMMKIIV